MQIQSLGWEDPHRRKWQSTAIFLPGKFHRQRSLVGYSLWGCKELDTTECALGCMHPHTHIDTLKYLSTHILILSTIS